MSTSAVKSRLKEQGEDSLHNILGLAHEVARPFQQAAEQLPVALQSKQGSIVRTHKVLVDTTKLLSKTKTALDTAFKSAEDGISTARLASHPLPTRPTTPSWIKEAS